MLDGKSDRMERRMINCLRSPLSFEVRSACKRLVGQAEAEPHMIVPMLLRNYGSEDDRVRSGVHEILAQVASSDHGMSSVLDEMVNPSKAVRSGLQSFLSDKIGAHAAIYASLYEQTMLMVAMAERKEVPVGDIVTLANQSKETFLNGEVMKAVGDIGYCLDHVKHRYRCSEQFKSYLTDLLKMAPDLARMGVYKSTIEEPLHKVMKSSQRLVYDETKDIVELRTIESRLQASLGRLARSVKDNIAERPEPPAELNADDRELLSCMQDLIEAFTSLVLEDRTADAISELVGFLNSPQANPFRVTWRRRVEAKERSASFTLFLVALASTKLAAAVLPDAAEEIYQGELRPLVEVPSIQLVMWPDHFLNALTRDGLMEPPNLPVDEGKT